jgi:hypothetical protein
MRRFVRIPVLAVAIPASIALGLSLGGCGGARPSGGGPGAAPDACLELPGEPKGDGSLGVLLPDPIVFSHAPVGWNDSEAVFFRLLYETLTTVECDGRVVPGLGGSWKEAARVADGAWIFRTRAGTGLPPGPASSRDPFPFGATGLEGRAPVPSGPRTPRFDSVRLEVLAGDVGEPPRVVARPDRPRDDLGFLLAHPAFSIVDERPTRSRVRPGGTGGTLRSFEGGLVWIPAPGRPARTGALRLVLRPGEDPRDAVDDSIDVVILRRREHVRFFENLDEFRVTPLPPAPTYWLVTSSDDVAGLATEENLEDLAARVTVSEARRASGATALRFSGRPRSRLPAFPPRPVPRIVVPEGDPDARALGERLAALLRRGRTAVVVEERIDRFLRSVAAGGDAAYVYPQRFRSPRAAVLRDEILDAAPWITERGGWALPLVETRAYVATRLGVAGIDCGWDGVPRLESGGWTGGARPE